MLQVARLAPTLLSGAADRVVEFLHEQFTADGGARDRAGTSDLYYTVFALEGLIALRQEVPAAKVRPYLESFGDGEGLDLVHLTCLARCWAALKGGPGPSTGLGASRPLAARIEAHRVGDGAFGNVYHSFLAVGALEDLGAPPAEPERLARAVASLQTPAETTPTTAAAVTLLHHLGAEPPAGAADWLLGRAHPKGGFAASEGAPIPDLLSTATALHALAALHVPVDHLKEAALDFIDTLWTGRAFCGSWADGVQDCEYTYYALLALGHLSLA